MNEQWKNVNESTPDKGQLILSTGLITVFEDDKEIHRERFTEPLLERYDGRDYCGNTTIDNGDGYVTVSKVDHWMPCPQFEEEQP